MRIARRLLPLPGRMRRHHGRHERSPRPDRHHRGQGRPERRPDQGYPGLLQARALRDPGRWRLAYPVRSDEAGRISYETAKTSSELLAKLDDVDGSGNGAYLNAIIEVDKSLEEILLDSAK